jgi:predicted nucleic acid-binding protein
MIVGADNDYFDRGLERFARRPDKEWSFTDCISFVVMEDKGLTDALTADHHFEQAGFTILLAASG